MQAAIVREPLVDLHRRNGPGLAPFCTLTQFMQVIYSRAKAKLARKLPPMSMTSHNCKSNRSDFSSITQSTSWAMLDTLAEVELFRSTESKKIEARLWSPEANPLEFGNHQGVQSHLASLCRRLGWVGKPATSNSSRGFISENSWSC